MSFSYDGRTDTLCEITLQAAPGQFVAIVGPTGAGKTTLVSLLPRFYAAGSGRILVDGIPVDRITTMAAQVAMTSVRQTVCAVVEPGSILPGQRAIVGTR